MADVQRAGLPAQRDERGVHPLAGFGTAVVEAAAVQRTHTSKVPRPMSSNWSACFSECPVASSRTSHSGSPALPICGPGGTSSGGVSDLFGMHPHTAYAWAQYAQNSWPEYREAIQATGKGVQATE